MGGNEEGESVVLWNSVLSDHSSVKLKLLLKTQHRTKHRCQSGFSPEALGLGAGSDPRAAGLTVAPCWGAAPAHAS